MFYRSVRRSVRSSVTNNVNTMFYFTNVLSDFAEKYHKWSSGQWHEQMNFGRRAGGQKSRSQESKVKFGGLAETSLSTSSYSLKSK